MNVLVRCEPADRFLLLMGLKVSNQVIAATGDGIYDANSLINADVGIAIGQGT